MLRGTTEKRGTNREMLRRQGLKKLFKTIIVTRLQ